MPAYRNDTHYTESPQLLEEMVHFSGVHGQPGFGVDLRERKPTLFHTQLTMNATNQSLPHALSRPTADPRQNERCSLYRVKLLLVLMRLARSIW